jgi:hypothetical protein
MIGNSKPPPEEAKPTENLKSPIRSTICEHRLPGSSLAHPDQMYLAAASINTTSDPKIMPNLPLEIIDNIFFFCTRGTLFNCLTLSQDYIGLAIMQLYRSVPTQYYRNVATDGKHVRKACKPAVFESPPNPSLKQVLRLAHYRYAVRDVDDVGNTLCSPDRLPNFAKIVADYPRIRGLKWKHLDNECTYSLERNSENAWTNLQLEVYHPAALLGRAKGQLKRLMTKIGTGVSSLKLYDWGDDREDEYYDLFWDMDMDMDITETYLAFVNTMGPHINQLQTLDISRTPYGEYSDDIEPVAKTLPPSLVNLTLMRRDTVEIERFLKCTLPNLAKFTFSLDFPDSWAYTSRSGASDEVKSSPNLKQAVMLVPDAHEWEYEPAPPSAMDTASWLADILPFRCDLTVKLDSEAMCCGRSSPHPWIHRWMIDVEKIYRFHRATMGKSG